MAVGTATGQVLLYDIRSSKPFLVKDHYYSLPIVDIEFHPSENMVLSMDSKIVKIWNQDSGEAFTSVEGESQLNDLCLIPNTGMFFIANEDKKILSYYIPVCCFVKVSSYRSSSLGFHNLLILVFGSL